MQLKIRRSQRQGGVVSKSVIFCLDARVEFAPDEKQSIARYKLHNEVIYNSEAQKRLLDKSAAQQDGSFAGSLKSLATVALAAMKLKITIASLERGQHIECASLDELLDAENALMEACRNLRAYLDTALTFDGREVLIDFTTGTPAIVAQAISPQPLLAVPSAEPLAIAHAGSPAAASTPGAAGSDGGEPWERLGQQARHFYSEVLDTPAKRYGAIAGGVFLLFLLLRSCAG